MASFKGLDTFLEVVDVISNPDKYSEKVKELKQLTANYTEAIEAVVKLADVNDYVSNIRTRDAKSAELLEAAKQEADSIVKTAQEFNKTQIAETNRLRAKLEQDQSVVNAKLAELAVSFETNSKEKQSILVKAAELAAKEKSLLTLEQEIKAKQQRLLEAMK